MSITSLVKSILFATFCALLAYGGYRVAQNSMNSPSDGYRSDLSYEKFDLTHQFINLDNTLQNLEDSEAKLYLINFWATWCAPCVTEMPLLDDIANDYKGQGLRVIGLSNDDSIDTVKNFLQTIPVNYPLLMNDNATIAATSALNPIGAIPFSLFVNSKGDILETKLGIFEDKPLRQQIESLLQQ